MQDNIPDALIAAFERHYAFPWDETTLRNERLAWRAAWAEATKPCLLQIQEPSSAEQAAWHAGLDAGRTQAAQNSAADVPASGAAALSEYLKTSEQHAIVPDVGGAFAFAFAAGFNLAASQAAPAAVAVPDERAAFEAKFKHLDLSFAPDAWGQARYKHDALSLAWEAWQARAALAATPAASAPLPLLVRDIARELGITCAEACLALKPLGNFSTNTAVTAEMMAKLRECFPERVPASEVAGARERMTAGRACYFMERFLKEEKLLGPNEQAALHYVIDMLEAAAAPVVLPEPVGWRHSLTLTLHETEEEVQLADGDSHAQPLFTEQQVRALLAGVSAPAALAVERGEVLVTVSGFTGSGKSAIAGEIEIMCRALGLQVEWPDSDSEKHMTHADWIAALEQYKPRVRIVECNVPHSVVKGQDK